MEIPKTKLLHPETASEDARDYFAIIDRENEHDAKSKKPDAEDSH